MAAGVPESRDDGRADGSRLELRLFLERVEFPRIWAVHFVVYGILGRGVSSSSRLDALGKGCADYLRDS